ncbi:MAG: WecB/TagA/CpsF family glycosyltransferase [Bacteroidetes bacterium]|nr:WecB/TagA/CpsF family glycosyltransferase [Bacteroidota bacterium]
MKPTGRVTLLGVGIDNLSSDDLGNTIISYIRSGAKAKILNVNIHCMNLAYQNPWLRTMLNQSEIVFCDGDGVRLGARLQGKTIREKITYNRWIWKLLEIAEKDQFSVYLIGSQAAVMEKTVEVLRTRFPEIRIAGYRDGFFRNKEDVNHTLESIRKARPNILILGMGMPLQEKWILEHDQNLSYNVVLTGGAVFDYISGHASMTPDWAYHLKLEWFYRFLHEPRRLFKRYIIGNPLFLIRILGEKLGFIRIENEK